jgi:Bax protein
MKFIFISSLLSISIFASSLNNAQMQYSAEIVPKNMSVAQKKERFFYLLVPAVQKVHKELMIRYLNIANDLKNGTNRQTIKRLKTSYKVKTDQELLVALKPHPQSIALAQAAMESSWATSRFFIEAKNIFGVRSVNKNEPRVQAGKAKKVWLKKFNTIEASVKHYYYTLAISSAFKEFRKVRMKTDNVHEIVKKLDKYSAIGHRYAKELSQIIKYNKLKKYDK